MFSGAVTTNRIGAGPGSRLRSTPSDMPANSSATPAATAATHRMTLTLAGVPRPGAGRLRRAPPARRTAPPASGAGASARRAVAAGGRGVGRMLFVDGGHEPVAVLVDRRDVPGAVGRVAEHLAEHGHVLRQAVFADVAVGPDPPHQLVLLDHAVRVDHEHLQQIEGLGREREDLVAAQQLPAAQVEVERAELVAVRRGGVVDGRRLLQIFHPRGAVLYPADTSVKTTGAGQPRVE